MPKVWIALFFGYNGQNFQGMQHQKQQDVNSIEKLVITTLYKQGLLACRNYNQLIKHYRFGRAARTDKGVHAVINGISCLFNIPEKYYDQSKLLKKNQLNAKIKQIFEETQIVIHCIKRVTSRFDIRQMVRSRTYCYICPKYYFINQGNKQSNTEQILTKINECCKKYIGTHNFHNYSKNLKAKDPSAHRYILQFECNQLNDKWYRFKIKGQSFVYHQIRKMVGCIIQVFLSDYEPAFIDNTFYNNMFFVPLSPPFGLYLRDLSFDSYNKRSEIPQKIEFQNQTQTIQKLQTFIVSHIQAISEQKWKQWYKCTLQGIVPKFQQDEQDAVDDN